MADGLVAGHQLDRLRFGRIGGGCQRAVQRLAEPLADLFADQAGAFLDCTMGQVARLLFGTGGKRRDATGREQK